MGQGYNVVDCDFQQYRVNQQQDWLMVEERYGRPPMESEQQALDKAQSTQRELEVRVERERLRAPEKKRDFKYLYKT